MSFARITSTFKRNRLVVTFATLLTVPLLFSGFEYANGFDDGFFWNLGGYAIDDAPAGGPKDFFEIYVASFDGNGGSPDTLTATVTSRDSGGGIVQTFDITLTEKSDNGILGVDHVLFMETNLVFDITSTLTISVTDPCDELPGPDTDGNCNPAVIETLSAAASESVEAYSDTTGFAGRIPIDLVETGPNTGLFVGKLKFSTSASNPSQNVLLANPGDRITVRDQKTTGVTNALISGDPDRIGLLVKTGGSVEVTAVDPATSSPVTDNVPISPPGTGGRGSGGLVTPGLVVDTPSNENEGGGSGCRGDCEPPTLGLDRNLKRIVKEGFSYNGNAVDVEQFYTPYPLITANVGNENQVILKIFDNLGPDNIEHVGLGYGLGVGESFSQSRATINFDRTINGQESISVFDPENVLGDVSISTKQDFCNGSVGSQCLIVSINHTFREPLEFNMVSTYVWDFNRNSWQNYYNHGVQIVGESLNPPKTELVAFGEKDMRGLYQLTRIDKNHDVWIDGFGNMYQHTGNNSFDRFYEPVKDVKYDKATTKGCNRECNWFTYCKLGQELLAKQKLNEILMEGP